MKVEDLTPQEIVERLDRHIVGQTAAKRAVAIALRNRYRRRQLDEEMREEIIPKNILMIGPTGVGKTEIARRLAALANAPMIKVEATKFTEVGYVGRDVDSMVRDLMETGIRLVEQEMKEEVMPVAEKNASERLLQLLVEDPPRRRQTRNPLELMMRQTPDDSSEEESEAQQRGLETSSKSEETEDESYRLQMEQTARLRERLRGKLEAGELDERKVEVEVEESKMAFAKIFSGAGLEEMGFDVEGMLGNMMGPKRTKRREVSVAEARRILTQEEADKLLDRETVIREATSRVEQSGIIFIDELDKVAGREKSGAGPDVSREGVQRDILPIVEGSTVITKYGPVRTNHVLFIAAGAFHISKPTDLIPELQGRFPIRVELEPLTEDDFVRILTEPKNALIKQYVATMKVEGVDLEFGDDAITEIARIARKFNEETENIGARRLHTVMEAVMEELSFHASELSGQRIHINAEEVRRPLSGVMESRDISRYIL